MLAVQHGPMGIRQKSTDFFNLRLDGNTVECFQLISWLPYCYNPGPFMGLQCLKDPRIAGQQATSLL